MAEINIGPSSRSLSTSLPCINTVPCRLPAAHLSLNSRFPPLYEEEEEEEVKSIKKLSPDAKLTRRRAQGALVNHVNVPIPRERMNDETPLIYIYQDLWMKRALKTSSKKSHL